MTKRESLIEDLTASIDEMLSLIGEQEEQDSDFIVTRELAEQLREEINAL